MGPDFFSYLAAGALGLLSLGLAFWALFWSGRAKGRRRCPKCWYDLSQTPGLRCSECGHVAKREKKLFKTRRRWRWAGMALLLLLSGAYEGVQPKVRKDGWASVTPTTILILQARYAGSDDAIGEIYVRSDPYAEPPEVPPWMPQWQMRSIASACEHVALNDRAVVARNDALLLLSLIAERMTDRDRAEAAMDVIGSLVSDPDPKVRAQAVALSLLPGSMERSIARVVPALADPDPNVAENAALALAFAAKDTDLVLAHLLALTKSERPPLYAAGIGGLGELAALDRVHRQEACDALLSILQDDADPCKRSLALSPFVMCQPDSDHARALLLAAIQSDDSGMRDQAVAAFHHRFRDSGWDVVAAIKAMSDIDPNVRARGACIIEVHPRHLVEPFALMLRPLLYSPDTYVRRVAREQSASWRQ